MTEEEARKKWCPYMDVRGYQACAGSDCMMWRKQVMVRKNETGEVFPNGYEVVEGHGYCGLGGKP